MKSKAVGMFAVLLMALSMVGVAYAHWSDVIRINGTVDMGSLTFGFTTIEFCEDGKMIGGVIVQPEPKDVGSVECRLDVPETDPHSGKTVYKKLWITITNGYPEYVAKCKYTLDNGGTIPLDVTMYCVVVVTNDGLVYGWEDNVIVGRKDLNGNGVKDPDEPAVVNIWFDPFFFGQIDPCNSVNQWIYIHLKEDAEECHDYKFEIEIHAEQWN